MATRASGPPARLTNAERMSLSRSLSSAPPIAITGPAAIVPSGPDTAGSVATLSLIALPATPAKSPHALRRCHRGVLPAISRKYAGHGYDLASGAGRAGFPFWIFPSYQLAASHSSHGRVSRTPRFPPFDSIVAGPP